MDNRFLTIARSYPGLKNKTVAFFRWLICPFGLMEKFIPRKGLIIDVGCGEGVFSLYLAYSSQERQVLGIDLNARKIHLAKQGGRHLKNLEFKTKNVLSLKQVFPSAIVISDAFHHLSLKDQESFLLLTKKILRKNGILLIKEINKDDLIRSSLSRLWDFLLYPRDRINYWSAKALSQKLQELGFQVTLRKAALFFPGSTVLLICSKK